MVVSERPAAVEQPIVCVEQGAKRLQPRRRMKRKPCVRWSNTLRWEACLADIRLAWRIILGVQCITSSSVSPTMGRLDLHLRSPFDGGCDATLEGFEVDDRDVTFAGLASSGIEADGDRLGDSAKTGRWEEAASCEVEADATLSLPPSEGAVEGAMLFDAGSFETFDDKVSLGNGSPVVVEDSCSTNAENSRMVLLDADRFGCCLIKLAIG